ncbi:MAG: hypothetical protein V4547_18255 [Bacteroidota bacterium]
MLRLLSLFTLQQIFEFEALKPLTPFGQLTYIRCLLYYFEGKEATNENCKAFELYKNEIPNPNSMHFLELQEAGLITLHTNRIGFPNKWYKYIDKSQLDKVTVEEHLITSGLKPAMEFQEEMLQQGSAFDLLGMRYRLKREQIETLIKDFFMEQSAKQKHYYSITDCSSHCINWFGKKKFDMPLNSGKSSGKILGRD